MTTKETLWHVLNSLYGCADEQEANTFAGLLVDIGVAWREGLPLADEDMLASV